MSKKMERMINLMINACYDCDGTATMEQIVNQSNNKIELMREVSNYEQKAKLEKKEEKKMNTASIINQFVKKIKDDLIESECFDEEGLDNLFEKNKESIMGLLQWSDGELNEMYAFKSPKFGKASVEYGYCYEMEGFYFNH